MGFYGGFGGGGFDLLDSLFPYLFIAVFALVLGVIVLSLVRGVSRYHRDNHSPVLTVWAKVVGKREDYSHHIHNANENHMHMSSTWYYATFEVDSGDRMELELTGEEYGLLAEGDLGELTFQGSRYLGFARQMG